MGYSYIQLSNFILQSANVNKLDDVNAFYRGKRMRFTDDFYIVSHIHIL